MRGWDEWLVIGSKAQRKKKKEKKKERKQMKVGLGFKWVKEREWEMWMM